MGRRHSPRVALAAPASSPAAGWTHEPQPRRRTEPDPDPGHSGVPARVRAPSPIAPAVDPSVVRPTVRPPAPSRRPGTAPARRPTPAGRADGVVVIANPNTRPAHRLRHRRRPGRAGHPAGHRCPRAASDAPLRRVPGDRLRRRHRRAARWRRDRRAVRQRSARPQHRDLCDEVVVVVVRRRGLDGQGRVAGPRALQPLPRGRHRRPVVLHRAGPRRPGRLPGDRRAGPADRRRRRRHRMCAVASRSRPPSSARSGRLVVNKLQVRTAAGRAGISLSAAAPGPATTWRFPDGFVDPGVREELHLFNAADPGSEGRRRVGARDGLGRAVRAHRPAPGSDHARSHR